MTAIELLQHLESVRARGNGKWLARCPAHADKSPSLSVKEGDDGRPLVHCFANCTLEEITRALGLRVADLFVDAPAAGASRRPPKPARINRTALAFRYELAALDLRLRAERVVTAARICDGADIDDASRDHLMRVVASAYADVERAELMEYVADTLRWKAFQERTIPHAA